MSGTALTIVLRLVHILAGIFWVGSIFLLVGFLAPAVRASGPEAGRFMQHLMLRRRLSASLGIAMGLTVLSGIAMYARLASATHGAWAGSRPGIVFGFGGLAAILGGIVGGMISGPTARKMVALGQEAAQRGGLSADQQVEMARLQSRSAFASVLTAALLLVAATAMAVARYL
ncbi:MAG TPA: hypothetical protein VIM84_08095 [Gemmatimonadales bacterium]